MVLLDLGVAAWLVPLLWVAVLVVALIMDEPVLLMLDGVIALALVFMVLNLTGIICWDLCPASRTDEILMGWLVGLSMLGVAIAEIVLGAWKA